MKLGPNSISLLRTSILTHIDSDHFNGNISIAGPQSSLIFYGAYNKSDTTTGFETLCWATEGHVYYFKALYSLLMEWRCFIAIQRKMLWFLNRVPLLYPTD